MIRNWLKKSTPEQEEKFREQLSEQELSFKDKLAIVLSAYMVLLVPAVLILIALSFLSCWVLGIF